jgi:5-methyltetrahydropteroyltriglutamate--homocysteine methyltransferase
MAIAHNLGFPRIGPGRELKKALEAYWSGEIGEDQLTAVGRTLREAHWHLQAQADLDLIPVNDFSFYDHVLDMSALLGAVPERFGKKQQALDLDRYFCMARGDPLGPNPVVACEMTKWFDTNYHYLVPEFTPDQEFRIGASQLFDAATEAQSLGHPAKPVLLGPLSYLWLGKTRGSDFDKLDLLERLIPVYRDILSRLAAQGVEWVQIDEPILVLDLPSSWLNAFERSYHSLRCPPLKILLATYFGALEDNTSAACALPIDGLHIDLMRGPEQLVPVLDRLGPLKVLSLGVVDGRNVWRSDLEAKLDLLEPIAAELGDRLWLAPSCSLLHCPMDLDNEHSLDPAVRPWLAFARQKLDEIVTLTRALNEGRAAVADQLAAATNAIQNRRSSTLIRSEAVRWQVAAVAGKKIGRSSPYEQRRERQRARLKLQNFPTTTIGSFPQTHELRRWRRDALHGAISQDEYEQRLRGEIESVIRKQEEIGLDVLVHGEPERNDMVEYFATLLDGFATTEAGWVQSYGSRCVKPPILYGDVSRPAPMTVAWTRYAQALTQRPVKGMLTGPVTILQWSFARDDQPRADTCRQVALALRDEVQDLERAGTAIIQVDEPALREGLPLRQREQTAYLRWATEAFRLVLRHTRDETQAHTHMCYAKFEDILNIINELDVDVITLEVSRSDGALVKDLADCAYPGEIGLGVFDVHSPRVASTKQMAEILEHATAYLAPDRLWVNPDCGLKTRQWPEVQAALRNMVEAAGEARRRLDQPALSARA